MQLQILNAIGSRYSHPSAMKLGSLEKKLKILLELGFVALFFLTVHLFSDPELFKMHCIFITSLYYVKSEAPNSAPRRASDK